MSVSVSSMKEIKRIEVREDGALTITVTGPTAWLMGLEEAIDRLGTIDVETPGGHGRNRQFYPGLGAEVTR